MRSSAVAIVAGLAAAASGMAAHAGTYVESSNPAVVEAYSGTSATSWSGFSSSPYGSEWGTSIGAPTFETTGVTVTWTASGGQSILNFAFTTGFSGDDSNFTPNVYAADLFIDSNNAASPTAPSGYNYAVALGFDGNAGGISSGLYQVGSELTSQQVWGGVRGVVYGGQYSLASDCVTGAHATCNDGVAGPTVLTSGTELAGVTETSTYTPGGGGLGTMDVELVGNGATGIASLNQVFGNGFDFFWGTGDCSNAPIWGDVPSLTGNKVPEPGSLAILASGLLCFLMLRRRRRTARVTPT